MLKFFSISLFVVFVDQTSKIYIKLFFDYYSSVSILGDFLRFTYIENPGIVFGLDVGNIIYYLISFLSLCIIFYILSLIKTLYTDQKNNIVALISFSLILGGAIGNTIDRFFVIFKLFNYQGVIDFIDIGINSYRFYIFNVADMSVTIGILLFIYYSYYIDNDMISE